MAPKNGSRARSAVLSLALAAGVLACAPDEDGTARMAERLEEIVANTDPEANVYANRSRVAFLRKKLARGKAGLEVQLELAIELLRSGKPEEAVSELEKMRGHVDAKVLDPWFAISWMRLGEQENCQLEHTIDSCLAPIRGSGVHRLRRGSESALPYLERLLAADASDLNARWLLNVAHMTLGSWPEGVPAEHLVPEEAFRSEHELGHFPDRAVDLGLDVMGLSGGAALEDFDGDGDLDVLCSSWGPFDPVRLFENAGDGSFAERTDEAGLATTTGGLNLVHADYDNDGDADVFLLRGAWLGYPPASDGGLHPNSLLENKGDGSFFDATEHAGLLTLHPTQTAAWGDFDGNGWLDLFVGNETHKQNVHPCELFLGEGGSFEEVAASRGAAIEAMVKGVAAGDVDDDGDLDLFLSVLRGKNRLLRNDGAGEGGAGFIDVAEEAGVVNPRRSFPTWFFDYDNDGDLDLFVSGYGIGDAFGVAGSAAADYLGLAHTAALPRLYRNKGDGRFEDATVATGLDRVAFTMGSNFGDLDNDGWLDLYLGTGDPDFRSIVPNRMFRNDAGRRFQDVTTSGGFGHLQKGHGIAFGDVDGDGDQDVYAVMGGAFEGDAFPNALFENPGHGNRWITLELVGTRSNRSAVGARIEVRVETPGAERSVHATVGTGGSFGSSSLRQELGLGDAERVLDVRVRWPGSTEAVSYGAVELDRSWLLREGDARPEPLERASFELERAGDDGGGGGHEHHHR